MSTSQIYTTQDSLPGNAPIDSPPRPPVSPITPVVSFAELAAQQLPPPAHPALHPPADSNDGQTKAKPTQHNATATAAPVIPREPPNIVKKSATSASKQFGASVSQQNPQAASQMQAQQSQTQNTSTSTKDATLNASQQSASTDDSRPRFMPPPELVDVNEEDNPDAAALRSALAILQIQRDKNRKDIKTLTKLRDAARSDPDAFIEQTLAGNLSQTKTSSDPLAATLESDSDAESEEGDSNMDDASRLPKFPTRQNIVRCPPVNWAKYHVVGEGLDRMHEDQRRRPTLGTPSTGDWTGRDHVIAAPYSPLEDRAALSAIEHPMVTRKGGKRL